jgi:uncharacterized protein (TIGR03437 family)
MFRTGDVSGASIRPDPGRPRRWRLAAVVAAVSLVATGLLVTTTASPSQAQALPPGYYEVPCPGYDEAFAGFVHRGYAVYKYQPVAVREVFDVAYGRPIDNLNSSTPRTVELTTSTTRTFSTEVTKVTESSSSFSIGFGVNTKTSIGTSLKRSVSEKVTDTIQTAIGLKTTYTVPPFTEELAEYGVQAYDVDMNVQVIFRLDDFASNRCFKRNDAPDFGATVHAPTVNEGWRFHQFRRPEVSSVVNPGSGMSPDDMQAGSVVTVNGDYFRPGADEVRVSQDGTTHTIRTGSFGWRDNENQIQVSLPASLRPGPATVRVFSEGRESCSRVVPEECRSSGFPVNLVDVAPRVNSVLNPNVPEGQPYTTENILPGSLVAIFGDRFTPGGDRVVVTQDGQDHTIQSGSLHWYDGPNQVNATLPTNLHAGPAEVRVVNVNGRRSAPSTITIADTRPRIISVVNPNGGYTPENIQPNTMVTIFGDRFRAGEDKVAIIQGTRQFLVQAGSLHWYDGPSGGGASPGPHQINFVLPAGLLPGEADVYVRNSQGNSDPTTIQVVDVPPEIRPNGVLNPAAQDVLGNWTAEDMRSGVLVAVFGDRFTSGGDKVLVTQGVNQFVVQAGSLHWYDGPSGSPTSPGSQQINFVLPAGLQPGPAEVRVLNVNGRQSEPAPITIVP